MNLIFGKFLQSAIETKDVSRLLKYKWTELYANTAQVSDDDIAFVLMAIKSDKRSTT